MRVMKITKSTLTKHKEGFILENVFIINGSKYKKSSYFTKEELNDNRE